MNRIYAVLVIDPDDGGRQAVVDALRERLPAVRVNQAADLEAAAGAVLPSTENGAQYLRLILVDSAAIGQQLDAFLQQLLKNRETPVPVVVWSAQPSPHTRERLYDVGVASILERPTAPADLELLVEQVARYWIYCNEHP
jgi:DNA-binding NarL/FixJ family response regulator